jgi:hypothetical protein
MEPGWSPAPAPLPKCLEFRELERSIKNLVENPPSVIRAVLRRYLRRSFKTLIPKDLYELHKDLFKALKPP